VGEELLPKQRERNEKADWKAGKAFAYLLLAGSIAAFSVSYWRLDLGLLHSVVAALVAIPSVALSLVPFIWTSKLAEYKGYDPRAAAILTTLATAPFLILLFVVLYMLGAPIWVCIIAPASIGLALATMYESAKRTRLERK
jgi:hypothetical protein